MNSLHNNIIGDLTVVNEGKGRGEAGASASVNKFVKSPIIYKTIPPRKNAGYGPDYCCVN